MVIEGFSNFLMVNVVPDFVAFLKVSKLGLGCMGLNGTHNSPLPEEDGIAVIKHAFDKGVTFFDTADVYGGPHTNEILVGKVHIFSLLLLTEDAIG